MNHQIYHALTTHTRFTPIKHFLKYSVIYVGLNLKTLHSLKNPLFKLNSWGIFSLKENDYLTKSEESLFDKTIRFTKQHSDLADIDEAYLVTMPRYLNWAFNPLSIYYLYSKNTFCGAIAEVSNTYKDRHIYILENPEKINKSTTSSQPKDTFYKFNCQKVFHVSPFFNEIGEYDFHLTDIKDSLNFHINYKDKNQKLLHADLQGRPHPFTTPNLFKTILKFPFTILLTLFRIMYQAAILHYLKKLPAKKRPFPKDTMTIQHQPPSLMQRLYQYIVLRALNQLNKGELSIEYNNSTIKYGTPQPNKDAHIRIKNPKLFKRIINYGEIGFGDGFIFDEWESKDITQLLVYFINNIDNVDFNHKKTANLFKQFNRFLHFKNKNTVTKSIDNIQDHYDLSNDLYKTFLDDSMMYSCAMFDEKHTTLESAQEKKINHIINSLDIKPGDHILEIGSGWGSIALQAAKQKNCKVTSITLSEGQLTYCLEKRKEMNLENQVDFLLKDYRNMTGSFSHIISIEMIEAVGKHFLKRYFSKINELLQPNGKVFIQAITMNNDYYPKYEKNTDWIQKHIFPGGHLPSPDLIKDIVKENTSLSLDNMTDIGEDYATTLKLWHERFLANVDRIKELGFSDEFINKWRYYFASCEAGFKTKFLHDYQFIFKK